MKQSSINMLETENKITSSQNGTSFLASSHFKISNDSRCGPNRDPETYKSIFKIDYPPLPLTKRERIPSPTPAGIMHLDERYSDNSSLTKSHFVEKPLTKHTPRDSYILRKTNFKADADEKLKSFNTTHKEYFPVRSLQEAKATPSTTKTEWMRSFIPQGDRQKEMLPQSDYRSRFLGEQGTTGPVFAKGDQTGRKPITGDPRTQNGQFITTTKTEFINRYLPKQKLDPSLFTGGSNLPQGDQEKCCYRTSTQQESFPKHKISSQFKPFNQEEAVKQLRRTTFQLGDQRSPGSLQTTASDSYPYPSMEGRGIPVNVNMGKSSFPEGDIDPNRAAERISKTTNDLFFGNPAIGHKNPKIDGSQIRTKSNVHLGQAPSEKFYDTTMKLNYTALPALSKTQPCSNLNKSSLPLDYYSDHVGVSTTWNDFPSRGGFSKLVPNPLALQNLKMSHIQPQIPGEMEYGTTHRRTYTPKKISRVDAKLGSLQRSSVPIGTLHLYQ